MVGCTRAFFWHCLSCNGVVALCRLGDPVQSNWLVPTSVAHSHYQVRISRLSPRVLNQIRRLERLLKAEIKGYRAIDGPCAVDAATTGQLVRETGASFAKVDDGPMFDLRGVQYRNMRGRPLCGRVGLCRGFKMSSLVRLNFKKPPRTMGSTIGPRFASFRGTWR